MIRELLIGTTAFVASACGAMPAESGPKSARSEAELLLAESLDYHDPERVWWNEPIAFSWTSTRPDGEVSYFLEVTRAPGVFEATGTRAGHELEYRVVGDDVWASVDGSTDVPAEVRTAVGLDRDDGRLWRDYVGFLAGLPMCLEVPGATIVPEVSTTTLEGGSVRAVEIVFEPDVGTDLWTVYFDSDVPRVVGCRFDRADPTKVGETIVFDGEVVLDGSLMLPRARRWFMNDDGRFLGTEAVGLPGAGGVPAGD